MSIVRTFQISLNLLFRFFIKAPSTHALVVLSYCTLRPLRGIGCAGSFMTFIKILTSSTKTEMLTDLGLGEREN